MRKRSRTFCACREIKCVDDQFPRKAFEAAGYPHMAVHGQKSYNGVAIVSRAPLSDVQREDYCDMGDARHISAVVEGMTVHNFYVPAGGDEPDREINDKFDHKLNFLSEMAEKHARGLSAAGARQVLVGDLNVAPLPSDVWSHKQLLKVVSHTPIEVEHLEAVIRARSWIDVARRLVPEPEPIFTWWSYRARDWRASNRGRRLDHIWVTEDLGAAVDAAGREAFAVHDVWRDGEKPSDHAPVSMTLAL